MHRLLSNLLLAAVLALGLFVGPVANSAQPQLVARSSVDAHAAVDPNLNIPDPCANGNNACIDPDAGWDTSWWWGIYCAYVPKWALEAVIWAGIAYYTSLAVVGMIADYTVAGLPVGIILGTVAITRNAQLGFALWWVDNYWGVGRRICV